MEQRLFAEAKELPPVTLSAALAYQEKNAEMCAQVDGIMLEQADILPLIGFSPLEIMKSNHRHHVQFMATVFRLNAFRLLPKVVVWVYRSYHSHGFSYEYFPRELSAWQTAVSSHLETSAASEVHRIYQWLIEHHCEFCELADSVSYATFAPDSADPQIEMEILLRNMLDNNYRACLELAATSIHSPEDLARFYQEVMTPALYEIGRLWEEGEISAVQEHLATAISMRIMSAMYGGFVLHESSKGKAVITAAPNEYHEVGARMVSDQLEMSGWQVDYLGANSPATDLLALLRQEPPFLLGFSIVVPFNIEAVRRIIEEIRADRLLKDIKVMVGGPVFALEPELCQKINADGFATSGGQAIELAGQWWEERTA
jgi:methanogenic corrinoid protein MtbC1